MEKWLEKLLGKELFDQVIGKLGDNKKHLLYQEKEGDFVPRSRIDEEKAKITKLEAELTTATEKVTTLENEKSAGTKTTEDQIKALNDKIEKLESDGKLKDQKLANDKKESALMVELVAKEAEKTSIPFLLSQFKKDGSYDHIELDANGKVQNFEDLHKPIFENNPRHYGKFEIAGAQPGGGGDGKNLGETETMTKYKALMAKKPEELTAAENLELNELAIKIKDEQNAKDNKE